MGARILIAHLLFYSKLLLLFYLFFCYETPCNLIFELVHGSDLFNPSTVLILIKFLFCMKMMKNELQAISVPNDLISIYIEHCEDDVISGLVTC